MEQVGNNLYEISNDAYLLDSPMGAAFIEFSDAAPPPEDVSPFKKIPSGKNQVEIAAWGKNNNLPADRERLIMDNNIVPALMEAKRDMLMGSGMMLYKERFEKVPEGTKRILDECPITPEIKDFLDFNESETYNEMAAKELILQANIFPEFLKNNGGKIAELELHECNYVRAEKIAKHGKNRPQINNWHICGNWKEAKKDNTIAVTNFKKRTEEKDQKDKYIRRFGNSMYGGPYYFSPAYWGSRNWIQLANSIPLFHLANLKHGYTLRYHIKFPNDFFIKSEKPWSGLTKEERKKALKKADSRKEKFMRKLDRMLSGAKNAGRTLYTSYDVQRDLGEKYRGVIVEPLYGNLQDEALLALFDKSNDANVSANGLLPSIAGVQTQGKMSSGSDIRNAFNFYIAAKTYVLRRNLFAAWNHIGKVNGWFTGELEGCQFGARDILIATTDKEPTGMKTDQNLN